MSSIFKKIFTANYLLFFKHARLFLTLLYHLLKVRRLFSLAQSLAFTTILSLVPLFAIFFSILGKITQDESILKNIKYFLSEYFIPQYGASVMDTLIGLSEKSFAFGVFGLPTLIVIGGFLYIKLDRSINTIWEADQESNWAKSGMAFFMTLFIGPILLALAFSLPPYLHSLPYYNELTDLTFISTLLSVGFPIVISTIGLFLLYKYIPHTTVWNVSAIVGGLFSGILLQLANWGVNWYLYNMSRFNIIYGSLAIFPIFLLWIYVVWIVVLVGASISFLWQKYAQTGLKSRFSVYSDESLLSSALAIMTYIVQAFENIKPAPTFEELHQVVYVNRKRLIYILKTLLKHGLVTRFIDDNLKGKELFRYQPGINPSKININKFYQLFGFKKTTYPFNSEIEELLRLLEVHPFVKNENSVDFQKLIQEPKVVIQNISASKTG